MSESVSSPTESLPTASHVPERKHNPFVRSKGGGCISWFDKGIPLAVELDS